MIALCAAIVVANAGAPAGAHPLGNFTVNRYARIEVSAGAIRIYYVLDEAEIPAFQERATVEADPAGFAERRAGEIAAGLTLEVDGTPLPLGVVRHHLSRPPGQGGLSTLRLAVLLAAAVPAGPPDRARTATLSDRAEPDRVGWREIVVTARGDARVVASDAPARDLSDELRSYPADLLQAPLDRRSASFTFLPGQVAVDALPITRPASAPPRAGAAFTSLAARGGVTPAVLAGMLAVALGVGAAHALAPGHGKTVMAVYLFGTGGRPRDAVLVGVIVSLMHTASVLALGAVLFLVGRSVAVDRIYPALTLASGIGILGVGAWLLRGRLRALRDAVTPSPEGGAVPVPEPALVGEGSAHAEGAGPHHGRAGHHHDPRGLRRHHGLATHTHELPPGISPLSRRGLFLLAASGGIVPSPSAVVVLVSAFVLKRFLLGLALIAAFSVGLAAALAAVGMAVVLGRPLAERRLTRRAVRGLAVAGAGALIVIGIFLSVQGALAL